MTTHLEWHQHAFLDKNNIVINVAVFEEWAHNHQLIEDTKAALGAAKVICCCQYGPAGIGNEWDPNTNSWVPVTSEIPPLEPIGDEFQV